MTKKIIIIGSGFSSISAATYLADKGYDVTGEEGFVAVDRMGNALKLVDRLEFSRANFTIAKDWVKG